jgi:pyruvate dehydrogenase E1 component beta subunit
MREGTQVTLIAHSRMVGRCMEAAAFFEAEGVSCEVINLRTIKPLDRQAIIRSVQKTHRAVLVEDGFPQSGVMAEVCAVICEGAFDELDAPIERLCGMDVPMPYAKPLEEICTPRLQDVVQAVKKVLGRN